LADQLDGLVNQINTQQIKSEYQETQGYQAATVLIALLFIVAIGFPLYFLPTFIGCRKRNGMAIFVLNLLAGWSFIGWVIAIVWACTEDQPSNNVLTARLLE
jgi:T4 superinfection immunity protein